MSWNDAPPRDSRSSSCPDAQGDALFEQQYERALRLDRTLRPAGWPMKMARQTAGASG